VAMAASAAAPPSSDALINGSLAVTPVPSDHSAPETSTESPHNSSTRWLVAFIVLFAVLGIMLGARSLLGRTHQETPTPSVSESPATTIDATEATRSPANRSTTDLE